MLIVRTTLTSEYTVVCQMSQIHYVKNAVQYFDKPIVEVKPFWHQ
jgi:hypothetical protein